MSVGDYFERTRTAHGMFDGVDDQRVTQANHQSDHHDAYAAASTRFPNQNPAEHDQQWDKQGIAAEKRHDPVKERVSQRQIDETEQSDVE